MLAAIKKHPSAFFRGFRRVFELPFLGYRSRIRDVYESFPKTTEEAWQRDWENIGNDFRVAVDIEQNGKNCVK